MPPLAPNCCALSKLAHKKANTNKVDRRFKSYRDQKKLKIKPDNESASTTHHPLPQPSIVEKSSIQDQLPLKVSREIANLQRNGSRASKSKSPLIFASHMTRSDSRLALPTKPATTINDVNKMAHRRNLISDFASTTVSTTVAVDTKEIKVKSAISTSRRNSLLDINGQPRKSPREHASTLAILSCLVQERKKREKELNGGISPDKMRLNDDEHTSDGGSYGDESNDTAVLTAVIKQEIESCDEDVESNDFQPTSSSAVTSDVKYEQIDGTVTTTTTIESTSQSVESTEPTKEDAKDDFKYPKMSRSDFVSPIKLYKQIDNLLHTSYGDDEDRCYPDVPVSTDESDDLILIGTPKDFVEILLSTTPGPLRYRSLVNTKKSSGLSSFSRSKKRRNNKTGWPTLPKRRILAKKEIEDDSNSCSNLSATEPDDECEDTHHHQQQPPAISDDRVDISDQLENGKDEYFIHSRQKLNSMGEDFSKDDEYSNDGNNCLLFPGPSDKAEYSDIFTVSSDSLDTDVTESNNKQQLDKDYDVISMKSIINVSDEDTSSADVTLAEMLKKQIGVGHKMMRCNRPNKNVKKSNQITNNVKLLQPIIYVKKINESETLNKFNKKNSPIKDESIVRNNPSPNTKCSPRKLRKPRGRWYRER